jgi:hypothetical protein
MSLIGRTPPTGSCHPAEAAAGSAIAISVAAVTSAATTAFRRPPLPEALNGSPSASLGGIRGSGSDIVGELAALTFSTTHVSQRLHYGKTVIGSLLAPLVAAAALAVIANV